MYFSERLPIVALTPFSLQDFPGYSACILWFTGCNFACPYCHNPDMALGRGDRLPWEQVASFLQARTRQLDGVVLSGGECTLSNAIPSLCRFLKSLGYLVKIDTNGSRPAILRQLLQDETINYVALDYKAPLDRYANAVGWGEIAQWKASLDLLLAKGIDFEIRCTVHPALLDETQVNTMLAELSSLGYRGPFYLQHFIAGKTLGNLTAPQRRFDPARLVCPGGMEIRLRNFTTYESQQIRNVKRRPVCEKVSEV